MPIATPKSSDWRPTAELLPPIKPSHRYGECLHTALQQKLEAKASQLLAKDGFFAEEDQPLDQFEDLFGEADYIPILPDMIGMHGGLRPTWNGHPT